MLETGRPVVVPRTSEEPALSAQPAPRSSSRQELTFLAVPITIGRRPAGVLELALPFKKDRDYDRSLEFYRVVASLVAQAVKVHRLVEAEAPRAERVAAQTLGAHHHRQVLGRADARVPGDAHSRRVLLQPV